MSSSQRRIQNPFKHLRWSFFAKRSIYDVWQSSESASATITPCACCEVETYTCNNLCQNNIVFRIFPLITLFSNNFHHKNRQMTWSKSLNTNLSGGGGGGNYNLPVGFPLITRKR